VPLLAGGAGTAAVARGAQGSVKDDCATLWFLGWNRNSTMSPTAAMTLSGSNRSCPLAPAITVCVTPVGGTAACAGLSQVVPVGMEKAPGAKRVRVAVRDEIVVNMAVVFFERGAELSGSRSNISSKRQSSKM
jgi:hypothetical protein